MPHINKIERPELRKTNKIKLFENIRLMIAKLGIPLGFDEEHLPSKKYLTIIMCSLDPFNIIFEKY